MEKVLSDGSGIYFQSIDETTVGVKDASIARFAKSIKHDTSINHIEIPTREEEHDTTDY